jgi:hypothetical protein
MNPQISGSHRLIKMGENNIVTNLHELLSVFALIGLRTVLKTTQCRSSLFHAFLTFKFHVRYYSSSECS